MDSIDALSIKIDELLTKAESKPSSIFSGRETAEDVEYTVQDAVSKDDGSEVIDIHAGHESDATEFDLALVTTEKTTSTTATVDDLTKLPAVFGSGAVVVNNAINDMSTMMSTRLGLLLDTLKGFSASATSSSEGSASSEIAVKLDTIINSLQGFSGASAKTAETKAADASSVEKTKVNAFDIKDTNSIKKSVDAMIKIYPSIIKLKMLPLSADTATTIKTKSNAFNAVVKCLGSVGKMLNENPELNDKPILDKNNSQNIKVSISNLCGIMRKSYLSLMSLALFPMTQKMLARANQNFAVLAGIIETLGKMKDVKVNKFSETKKQNIIDAIKGYKDIVTETKSEMKTVSKIKEKTINTARKNVVALAGLIEATRDFAKIAKKAERITFNENKLIKALMKPFEALEDFNKKYEENNYKASLKKAKKNVWSLVPAILSFGAVALIAGVVGLLALIATPAILAIVPATFALLAVAWAFKFFGNKVKTGDILKALAPFAVTGIAVLAIGALMWSIGKMSDNIIKGVKTIPQLLIGLGLVTALSFAFALYGLAAMYIIGPVAMAIALLAITAAGVLMIGALLSKISDLDRNDGLKNAPKALKNYAAGIAALSLVALAYIGAGILMVVALAFTPYIMLFVVQTLLMSYVLIKIGANAAKAKKGIDDLNKALDGLVEAGKKVKGISFSGLNDISKQINKFVSDLKLGRMLAITLAMRAMAGSMSAMASSAEKLAAVRMEVPTANAAPTSKVASNASTSSESPKVIQEPVKQVMADQAAANTATAVNNFENTTAAKTSSEKKAEDTQISYKSEFERVISAIESLSSSLANAKSKDSPLDYEGSDDESS